MKGNEDELKKAKELLEGKQDELATTREMLVQREQVILNHEAELEVLRAEEAAKLKRDRELQDERKKLESERAELRQRIVELEVRLEEEKASNQVIVEPDAFIDQSISQDPAVVSTVPGMLNEIDFDQQFEDIFDVLGNHMPLPDSQPFF